MKSTSSVEKNIMACGRDVSSLAGNTTSVQHSFSGGPCAEDWETPSAAERSSTEGNDSINDSFNVSGNIKQRELAQIPDNTLPSSTNLHVAAQTCTQFILTWFPRNIFRAFFITYTVVSAKITQLGSLEFISNWFHALMPSWLGSSLFQKIPGEAASRTYVSAVLSSGGGKMDPHAWPPPALTALALLTIFALVVHPDGLTWILLGKLRDAMVAVIYWFGQCMELLINDYGILPTIIASITMGAMLFLIFVVIRTLSPKKACNVSSCHSHAHNHGRKRKKKKGGNTRYRRDHHHHHRSNRIKYASQLQSSVQPCSEVTECQSLGSKTTQTQCSPPRSSSPPQTRCINNELHASPALPSLDSATNNSILISPLITPKLNSNPNSVEDKTHDKMTSESTCMHITTDNSKESSVRRRMLSASTMDTLPMSDDQSCGSISIKSYPSVSVSSNRSGSNARNRTNYKNSSSVASTATRRGRRNKRGKSPKQWDKSERMNSKGPVTESSISSRWDALKPETCNYGNNGGNHSNRHSQSKSFDVNGIPISCSGKHQRYQKGKGRRGVGSNRKDYGRKGLRDVSPNNREVDLSTNSSKIQHPYVPISARASISQERLAQRKGSNKLPDVSLVSPTSRNPPSSHINCSRQSGRESSPPPGFQRATHSDTRHQRDRAEDKVVLRSQHHICLGDQKHSEEEQEYSERISADFLGTLITPQFFQVQNLTSPSLDVRSNAKIEDNPFRNNGNTSNSIDHYRSISPQQANIDSQIEADLQELGGQMAGSILDF